MTTSNTKLAYYNGWWWRTSLLADGTRAVQPFRARGGPAMRRVLPRPPSGWRPVCVAWQNRAASLGRQPE